MTLIYIAILKSMVGPIASGMKIIVKNEENEFSLKDITINDKKIDTEKEYSILTGYDKIYFEKN